MGCSKCLGGDEQYCQDCKPPNKVEHTEAEGRDCPVCQLGELYELEICSQTDEEVKVNYACNNHHCDAIIYIVEFAKC